MKMAYALTVSDVITGGSVRMRPRPPVRERVYPVTDTGGETGAGVRAEAGLGNNYLPTGLAVANFDQQPVLLATL
jgi:hypothetical protein